MRTPGLQILILLVLLPVTACARSGPAGSGSSSPSPGEASDPGAYARGRIDLGLVVSDLERSVAFYQDALGLQRAYSFDVPADFAREAGLTAGAPLHAVALRLTAEADAPLLKLVRTGEPRPYRPGFITDQSGVRYLTVFVTALEPVLERLERHAVPVLGKGPVQLSDGQFLALVQDPDGVFIELIGPMRASVSP